MTCTRFSLNTPPEPHRSSASGPSSMSSVPQTHFICPLPCPISKYVTGFNGQPNVRNLPPRDARRHRQRVFEGCRLSSLYAIGVTWSRDSCNPCHIMSAVEGNRWRALRGCVGPPLLTLSAYGALFCQSNEHICS